MGKNLNLLMFKAGGDIPERFLAVEKIDSKKY